MNLTASKQRTIQLIEAGFNWAVWQQNPTALDILAQMPEGTRLAKHGAGWVCAWDLDFVGASVDNREDECPHECAAKAFLAWKAGLE